jgi:hypothetical protein
MTFNLHFAQFLETGKMSGVHLSFANIFVGAKHDRSKSLVSTNKLSAGMLRPYKIEMLPMPVPQKE